MIIYMHIVCINNAIIFIECCFASQLLSNRTFSMRDGIVAEIKSVSNASHRRVWKFYYIALSSSQCARPRRK